MHDFAPHNLLKRLQKKKGVKRKKDKEREEEQEQEQDQEEQEEGGGGEVGGPVLSAERKVYSNLKISKSHNMKTEKPRGKKRESKRYEGYLGFLQEL